MKVLMFGWEFPPRISGGLGTACYGLTKSLSHLGTDILFVLPRSEGPSDYSSHLSLVDAGKVPTKSWEEELTDREDRINYLPVNSTLHPYMTVESYEKRVKHLKTLHKEMKNAPALLALSGSYGPNLMSEVRRYAVIGSAIGRSEHFDVIHAHDWLTYLAGIEAKKRSGKPLITHVHATEFDRTGEHVNQEIYDIERTGMEHADRVIAVSHWTRNKVIERYGIDPSKVTVVHNGISKQAGLRQGQSQKHLNEKIVLFLGRVTMQKGPEYFLEAARIVLDKVKNTRFVMAGTGDLLPSMIERMAALRLHQHFHFTGFLEGERRSQMYAMSNVFVMPSVSEPFGITPVEALQYGVPIIISRQSGVSEVLPHAIKIDFWDVQKMADCIIDVLTNEETSRNAKENGLRELASIDWDITAKRTVEVYQSLVG